MLIMIIIFALFALVGITLLIRYIINVARLSNADELLRSGKKTKASVAKIIIGIIFFVGGLVSLISRGELMVKIVGKSQIMHEAFFGGSSASDALTAIIVISSIAMIIGLALSIWGLIQIQQKH